MLFFNIKTSSTHLKVLAYQCVKCGVILSGYRGWFLCAKHRVGFALPFLGDSPYGWGRVNHNLSGNFWISRLYKQ